jgi:hypothetical protein|mmetsp:Transcript_11338/g.20579  ORF Transcript_11338/g.20579 Transcript_11338/m.20579 type:complete len:236 (+) Transcript_11338:106-813(+)
MPSKRKEKEGPPPISAMLSSAHDLDVPLNRDDLDMVENFEACWSVYMQEHPELMPAGGRSKKLIELKSQVMESKLSLKKLEHEYENQLKVFGKSRDLLEINYQKGMQEALKRQKTIHALLQRELDRVLEADELESQIVPWEHFLASVDKAALVPLLEPKDRSVKPSSRAMALVENVGDPSDVQLRAFRIDHALLTAQVEMLQREIEKVEKTTKALDLTGEFLTENNIWALLSKTR